jgi:hypothetical protein
LLRPRGVKVHHHYRENRKANPSQEDEGRSIEEKRENKKTTKSFKEPAEICARGQSIPNPVSAGS